MKAVSWEAAVHQYRESAAASDVAACYFDQPIQGAAARFARSEEFDHAQSLLNAAPGRRVVDLGAGLGIASWAWATAGWTVAAIEPDPSAQVGAGSVRELCAPFGSRVEVHVTAAEALDLPVGWADAVYARQMLHHARDLDQVMREVSRVLRPGGLFLACRDHVVDRPGDLEKFLTSHPLHHLYGGEHAYALGRYLGAARDAGLVEVRRWGPEESMMNFFPGNAAELALRRQQVARSTWRPFGAALASRAWFQSFAVRRADARHQQPGRLYSFLWRRP